MLYAFQLGRLPRLGKAELSALFPSHHTVAEDDQFLVLDIAELAAPQKIQDRCGGIIRIMEVSRSTEATVREDIEALLLQKAKHAQRKFLFGISIFDATNSMISNIGRVLKDTLRAQHISSRFVEEHARVVSTASVIHNHLIERGMELIVLQVQGQHFAGHTVAIQQIEAYTQRDMAKPVRDMKRGMLPPKLAQVMLNIARVPENGSVLDPFCGVGTILMEALLMQYGAYGSDIDALAVTATQKNVRWTQHSYPGARDINTMTMQCDAQELSSHWNGFQFDAIVTEGHLGPQLTNSPSRSHAIQINTELLTLYKDVFAQAALVVKKGGAFILTTPAFRVTDETVRIQAEQLREIAGNKWQLSPVLTHEYSLLYERPDQFVGRELWRFIRQ